MRTILILLLVIFFYMPGAQGERRYTCDVCLGSHTSCDIRANQNGDPIRRTLFAPGKQPQNVTPVCIWLSKHPQLSSATSSD